MNWHLTGQLGASCKFIMPRLLQASKHTLEMHMRAHRVRLHRFQIQRAGSPQQTSGEATNARGEVRDLKKSLSFFPALGHRPVVENYSCQKNTHRLSGNRLHRFQIKPSGLSAGRLPIADARHRFAAGSARRIAKRKQGKNIWGPLPGLCSRAERRFIFYPSSLASSPHNSRWC